MKILILLGAPGAGKGTQAYVISKMLQLPKLSTGDMCRAAASDGTLLGDEVAALMHAGQFVPDPLVMQLLLDRIKRKDCDNGFILDGFPRNLHQADSLDKMFGAKASSINVVNITVDEEEIVRRISGRFSCKKCGASYHKEAHKPKIEGICDLCGAKEFTQREDDKAESVKVRLQVYKEQTMPLIEYYSKSGRLVNVNGMQSVESVTAAIISAY